MLKTLFLFSNMNHSEDHSRTKELLWKIFRTKITSGRSRIETSGKVNNPEQISAHFPSR